MSFNLVDEPWIPVVLTDGSAAEVSIRDAFTTADGIQRISADLPTQSFAILRLLLAIHHDAVGFHSESDVAVCLRDGLAQEALTRYLGAMSERFDLFHPERPFMQIATLSTARGESAPLEKLISDVPNGAPFMTTRGGVGLSRITPAEAARWLVHCQAFDPSGIRSAAVGDALAMGGKGYPIGPAWAGQIGGVVLHGRSLAQTLSYNIVPTPRNQLDRPVWALELPQSEQRELDPSPAGPVAVLVWQSRRVRLIGDRNGVTGVVLAQGDKMTPQNRQELEHMTAWRFSPPQTKKHGIPVYMPKKHDPSRSGWRGMPGLVSDSPKTTDGHADTMRPANVRSVAGHSEEFAELDTEVIVEFVGMDYGPQEATVNDVVHDTLDLRMSMLGDEAGDVQLMLFDVVDTADKAVWALGRMASNIASASGDFDGLDGARDTAREVAWAELDQPARNWLQGLTAETDTIEARRQWQSLLREVLEPLASSMASRCGPAAITGRKTKFGFMTASKAESLFRHALRQELPLAYPARPDKEQPDEQ